jgi:hypothetical protein
MKKWTAVALFVVALLVGFLAGHRQAVAVGGGGQCNADVDCGAPLTCDLNTHVCVTPGKPG